MDYLGTIRHERKFSMINNTNFTDLKSLSVDTTKPLDNRIKQYISDVKNPYKVRVGDIIVQIEFGGGQSFSNALVTGFQI